MSAPPDKLTVAVLAITVGVATLVAHRDWLMVGFGPYLPVYWGLVVAWAACLARVILRRRRWWLLSTAPVVLYPAARVAGLLVECAQKSCAF